ncbi:hypothetical protein K439DRAFT_1620926 [Ramaria rubella]|nr:hypothetical protein K439DRAFT_1620926 [Ramaria rubella]
MSISRDTLYPLMMASFILDYRMEGQPLQVVAKRFTYPGRERTQCNSSSLDITLLMIAGIGCESELWLPAVKYLFKLQSQSKSKVNIRDVWTLDWPNAGDAAVINELFLKENYATSLTPRELGIAARNLVHSGLLDLKGSKLVGVGHSGGFGGILFAEPDIGYIPFDAVILVEPPLLSKSVIPAHKEYISRSIDYHIAQPDVWPTIEDAMRWHRAKMPWRSWHPEALQVFSETHFQCLPTAYHTQTEGVTSKTYKGQVGASFNAGDYLHICVDLLGDLCSSCPVHVIFGSKQGFWPKSLAKSIKDTTQAFQSRFASVTYVPNTTHYVNILFTS